MPNSTIIPTKHSPYARACSIYKRFQRGTISAYEASKLSKKFHCTLLLLAMIQQQQQNN